MKTVKSFVIARWELLIAGNWTKLKGIATTWEWTFFYDSLLYCCVTFDLPLVSGDSIGPSGSERNENLHMRERRPGELEAPKANSAFSRLN